jgi:hypothetical protein
VVQVRGEGILYSAVVCLFAWRQVALMVVRRRIRYRVDYVISIIDPAERIQNEG